MKLAQLSKRTIALTLLLGLTALLVGRPMMVDAQGSCIDAAGTVCTTHDNPKIILTDTNAATGAQVEAWLEIHKNNAALNTRIGQSALDLVFENLLNDGNIQLLLDEDTPGEVLMPRGRLKVDSGVFRVLDDLSIQGRGNTEWLHMNSSELLIPQGRLKVDSGILRVTQDGLTVQGTGNEQLMRVWNNGRVAIGTEVEPSTGIKFEVNGGGIQTDRILVEGTATTGVLQITGGADLAEPFAMTDADAIEPGMVVAIDPENPGQLRLAHSAYDRGVAGIVSGAGGIQPGITLQQEGTLAVGDHPVSLSGRVYVWADASYGPIQPTDLLTSSDTSGHAMKVTDYKHAHGAIIGKAMTGLEEGKGLVLVLVTLH
ncbi:MAG: hypothetical protein R2867_02005 [Caldilineaceae bacterium]